MRNPDLKKAAAILGRKGGKASGKSKARTGISERMKAWWASPAAAHRRKKPKPKDKNAIKDKAKVNPFDLSTKAPAPERKDEREGGS